LGFSRMLLKVAGLQGLPGCGGAGAGPTARGKERESGAPGRGGPRRRHEGASYKAGMKVSKRHVLEVMSHTGRVMPYILSGSKAPCRIVSLCPYLGGIRTGPART